MGTPATWLEQPMTRVRALVEGTYPTTPSTSLDRYITGSTFKSTRLHGDMTDPDFPDAMFHRGYDLLVNTTGFAPPDEAHNTRCVIRRAAMVTLRVGYTYGKDHPLAHSQGVTSKSVALELGHTDMERLEWVLTYPKNWLGTDPNLYSILRVGDVTSVDMDPTHRLIVQADYRVEVNYQPWRYK